MIDHIMFCVIFQAFYMSISLWFIIYKIKILALDISFFIKKYISFNIIFVRK